MRAGRGEKEDKEDLEERATCPDYQPPAEPRVELVGTRRNV